MIYFLIPVFNEAENIPQLASSLNQLSFEWKVIIVDDGSTDGTGLSMKQHFRTGQIHILNNPANKGPGYSFNRGFEWILQNSNPEVDLVVTLEGDNTSDLDSLHEMITLADSGCSLVLASVYMKGGSISQTNAFKIFLSEAANRLARSVFSIHHKTLTSFYRVYKISLLRQIKNKYGVIISENGFLCKLELLLKARQCGARVCETPTHLQSHLRKGKSKMKIFRTGLDYLRFILLNAGKYRQR